MNSRDEDQLIDTSLVRGRNAKVLEKPQNSSAAADPKCSHRLWLFLQCCVFCVALPSPKKAVLVRNSVQAQIKLGEVITECAGLSCWELGGRQVSLSLLVPEQLLPEFSFLA